MVGFFSKKQYAAMAESGLAIKLLKKRCLECSETVLNLLPKAHTKRIHQVPKTFCIDSKQFLKAL
ncbi:hypothetical protein B5F71_07535 [Bacteroides sp. An269]|nr:hypothetical protein B5F71_07535 [Bacteroides sp. An269]